MENLIPITLWLAGRSYRIRIKSEDEEAVRLAVKQADKHVNEMRHHYSGKDDHDFLAMSLLTYATSQSTESGNLNLVQQDTLQSLINRIDEVLAK